MGRFNVSISTTSNRWHDRYFVAVVEGCGIGEVP
jgi:hypothetical protein